MPSRVIQGTINRSASLARVSLEAEHLFRALLLVVDDYGRTDARLPILKAECVPLRTEYDAARIRACLVELCSCDPGATGPVRLYEVDGRPYLVLVNWERHRWHFKRAKHSKYPPPPLEVIDGGAQQLKFADVRRRREAESTGGDQAHPRTS
jgi:hypothetical protein